jgi:hypothetical protein
VDTPGSAWNVAVAADYVVLADDADGLRVLALACAGGSAVTEPAEPHPDGTLFVTPNPTRGEGLIRFTVPANSGGEGRDGTAWLLLYDAGGRLVRRLAAGSLVVESNVTEWDGRNATGHRVPAGIYLARVVAGSRVASGRVVLVR